MIQLKEIKDLISSMSKSEKRHFTLYASRHVVGEENLYLTLFCEIERLKEPDKINLARNLSKRGYNDKHLSQRKYYLYRLILKSLNAFHSASYIDAELSELLSQVQILYRKGLSDQYEKLISKAKKIAYENEKYLKLLEIFQLEKRMILSSLENHANLSHEVINKLEHEENKLIDFYEECSRFEWQELRLNSIMLKHGSIRNAMQLKPYNAIVKHPDMSLKNLPTSLPARIIFLENHAIYNSVRRNFKESLYFHELARKHMETSPTYLSENILIYIPILGNIAQCSINLEMFEKAEEAITALWEVYESIDSKKAKVKEAKVRAFIYYSLLKLRSQARIGKIEEAKKTISEIQAATEKQYGLLGQRNLMLLKFHISQIYFIAGDYKKALRILNTIINDKSLKLSPQLEIVVRIVNILIHIELGNYDIIESNIRNSLKDITKTKHHYQFEIKLLKFLEVHHYNLSVGKETFNNEIRKLGTELKQICQNPYENRPLDYFDFFAWLESKAQNRPMLEVIKIKPNTNSLALG